MNRSNSISLLLRTTTVLLSFTSGLTAGTIRSSHYNGDPGDGVRFPFESRLNRNVAMTVEAWVYREDATRCEAVLSQGFGDSYFFGFCPRLRFYRGGGSFADASIDVPARQWTHVAASYDGTHVRFYIDGEPAGVEPLSNAGAASTDDVWVGRDPFALGLPPTTFSFRGYLDEIRLWSSVRSAAEIRDHRFDEPRGEPGLEAVWAEGGAQETLSGTTGTLTGRAVTSSAFGILPSALRVPGVALTAMALDGDVDLRSEYHFAEQAVLRYSDGASARDATAYIVHRAKPPGDPAHLFIGVKGARLPLAGTTSSAITLYFDGDGNRSAFPDANDYLINVPYDGSAPTVKRGGFAFPFFGWGPVDPALSSHVSAVIGTPGSSSFELPDMEIRVSSVLVGGDDFVSGIDGLAIAHRNIGAPPGDSVTPGQANSVEPGTWSRLSYQNFCDSSIILARPPGWDGFRFTTRLQVTLTPEDGAPAGAPLVLSDSQVGHVIPTATRVAGEHLTLPTTRVESPDGQFELSLDVWFDVGSATEADKYGWDISVFADNPMVDFGDGPEPADIFIEYLEVEIESFAPLLIAGACFQIPPMPAIPAGIEQALATFVFPYVPRRSGGAPSSGLGYSHATNTNASPGFFNSLWLGEGLSLDYRFRIGDEFIPSGDVVSFDYSISGCAGVNAAELNSLVGQYGDFGGGSLREMLGGNSEDIIGFHPALDGGVITLEQGPLQIFGQQVTVDASQLPNGITIDAGGLSRVFEIGKGAALTLNNVTITRGVSKSSGGGIYNEGELTLINCKIRNCRADQGGGGIFNDGGTSNTFGGIFENNQALFGGGIAVVDGIAIIGDTLIEGNTATENGGGIYLSGDSQLELKNSSLLGNAANAGGGIYQDGGTSNTFQGTFFGNVGVAHYNLSGIAIIGQTTISGNAPGNNPSGGVIGEGQGQFEFHGTILAGNGGGDAHVGGGANFNSLGHNLVGFGNAAGDFNAAGDWNGIADPLLSPPGRHGGPVPTMIPEAGSLARDAGEQIGDDPPNTDARGYPRIVGPSIDIGAYEAGSRGAGYPAWAAETIPAGLDRAFDGNADLDPHRNGLEFVLGTDPLVSDPQHPNNPTLAMDEEVEFAFGFAPGITGVGWKLIRSDNLLDGIAIIGLKDATDAQAPDVSSVIGPSCVRIFDGTPSTGRGFYQLSVFPLSGTAN